MNTSPILFSGPMVRALLAGTKTQTRRVVKVRGLDFIAGAGADRDCPGNWGYEDDNGEWGTLGNGPGAHSDYLIRCPYGQPGTKLWVRETWHGCPHCADGFTAYRAGGFQQRAGGVVASNQKCELPLSTKCAPHGWKPSIHMHRHRSRITLEITGVRVERLQAISEEDARAEGCDGSGNSMGSAFADYVKLWESINGAGSWNANPFVWVVSFKRLTP